MNAGQTESVGHLSVQLWGQALASSALLAFDAPNSIYTPCRSDAVPCSDPPSGVLRAMPGAKSAAAVALLRCVKGDPKGLWSVRGQGARPAAGQAGPAGAPPALPPARRRPAQPGCVACCCACPLAAGLQGEFACRYCTYMRGTWVQLQGQGGWMRPFCSRQSLGALKPRESREFGTAGWYPVGVLGWGLLCWIAWHQGVWPAQAGVQLARGWPCKWSRGCWQAAGCLQ